ncbi:MAG: hydroxymethylpyrimidine/phosphomethylpyrimidine kinase [Deltaproteobacteria bacterium]|nr:hydroxymethylpyrimidine/phosphomethylpyrimidine kinase [Deltaproteobacteria bacterium]
MKTILTIGGFDPTSGAGVTADIKTALSLGVYALGALTCITAQNTEHFSEIEFISPNLLEKQLEDLRNDFSIDAIKLSITGGSESIEVLTSFFSKLQCPVIFDPVLISTTGGNLNRVNELNSLYKYCTLITPNRNEMKMIGGSKSGNPIDNAIEFHKIHRIPVFLKSANPDIPGLDVLIHNDNCYEMLPSKNEIPEIHGTGCKLSTIIACLLIENADIVNVIENARNIFIKNTNSIFQPSGNSWLFH